MRLDRLTPAHVRRAVAIYMQHAWPPGSARKPLVDPHRLDGCETLEEVLGVFRGPGSGEASGSARRYTLQLGNHRYLFMKLVIQEYLVGEEYFFSVDTHDEFKITEQMPDYAGWLELRRFNATLKHCIEADWQAAGLPTHEALRTLMEGLAQVETQGAEEGRLLVADDERDVARGVAAVLSARGYQVETAFNGLEVLERMARPPSIDLLVLDYSMPEMDGEEVMARLRAQEAFAELPILLATATDIDLSTLSRATGLLRKPYLVAALYRMIRELLAEKRKGSNPRE